LNGDVEDVSGRRKEKREKRKEKKDERKSKRQKKRPTVHPLQLFPVPLELVDSPIDDDDPLAPLIHLRIVFPSRSASDRFESRKRRFGLKEGRMS
jgi:hypothetical protein